MHLFKIYTKRRFVGPVLSALIFIAIVALIWVALTNTQQRGSAEQAQLLKDTLRRASVSCYAVEGRYPPSLQYLVDNYGVLINDDKYIVRYSAFGENIMPTIRVLEVGKELSDDAFDDEY